MTDFVHATGAAGPAVPGAGATHVALPDRFGDCWIERTALDDGLTVVHSHYRPTRELAEETVQTGSSPTLVITLGLAGESGFVAREGTRLRFRAGHTTLTAFNESRGERRFNAEGAVRRTAPGAHRNGAVALPRRGRCGPPGQPHGRAHPSASTRRRPGRRALLRPLVASEAATPLDRHIAALTLAADYLRPLMPTGASAAPSSTHLGADDIDKLQRARDLMQNHMDRALTIAYLSATVGMNECKFKQGFRELFGAPPHRFLLELRMRRAWTLLESGSRVAQAAYAVGYEHPASFSAAFARYFGRTPKSVR